MVGCLAWSSCRERLDGLVMSCMMILQGTSWWPGGVLHDHLAGNVLMAWWFLACSSCMDRLDGLVVSCMMILQGSSWWSGGALHGDFAGIVLMAWWCLAWWSCRDCLDGLLVSCMIILKGTLWWPGGRVSCMMILQGSSWWPGGRVSASSVADRGSNPAIPRALQRLPRKMAWLFSFFFFFFLFSIFKGKWVNVSHRWLDEDKSFIRNFCPTVAARPVVWADPSLRYPLYVCATIRNQETTGGGTVILSWLLCRRTWPNYVSATSWRGTERFLEASKALHLLPRLLVGLVTQVQIPRSILVHVLAVVLEGRLLWSIFFHVSSLFISP